MYVAENIDLVDPTCVGITKNKVRNYHIDYRCRVVPYWGAEGAKRQTISAQFGGGETKST